MKKYLSGEMISGELSLEQKEFTVTEIKNISTQSTWNETQLREMYNSLAKAKNSGADSLVITTGMLPVLINQAEMDILQRELHSILSYSEMAH